MRRQDQSHLNIVSSRRLNREAFYLIQHIGNAAQIPVAVRRRLNGQINAFFPPAGIIDRKIDRPVPAGSERFMKEFLKSFNKLRNSNLELITLPEKGEIEIRDRVGIK